MVCQYLYLALVSLFDTCTVGQTYTTMFFSREYFNCIALLPVILKCIVYMYYMGVCTCMLCVLGGRERMEEREREGERDRERRKGEGEPHGMYTVHMQLLQHFYSGHYIHTYVTSLLIADQEQHLLEGWVLVGGDKSSLSTWNCSAAQGYIPSGKNRRCVHTSKYMYVSYRDKYSIVNNCWFDLRGGGGWWSQTLIFFQRRGRKIFCMENNYECMGDLIFWESVHTCGYQLI